MALSKQELIDLYRRRASNYDVTSNLYYLIGMRMWEYRRRTIEALELSPGDTVVEIGCGTGLNFSLLRDRVGREGRVVGVDLNPAMLEQARARVDEKGWDNVELHRSDAAEYRFPEDVDGVISTLALTLVPEYEAIIHRASEALEPEGRFALLDMRRPDWVSEWMFPVFVLLARPFGATPDLQHRHPWETIREAFPDFRIEEFYFGLIYLAVGAHGT